MKQCAAALYDICEVEEQKKTFKYQDKLFGTHKNQVFKNLDFP